MIAQRLTLSLAILLAAVLPCWAKKDEALDELKSRAETASIDERPAICVRVAELQLEAADKLFTDGKADQARTALVEVSTYSEKAGDAAVKSGKKLKPTEIAIRKMAHRLRDIKRTLAFEDQGAAQEVVDRLERIRTDLLAKMFGKGEK
jgi:hypothetical protein